MSDQNEEAIIDPADTDQGDRPDFQNSESARGNSALVEAFSPANPPPESFFGSAGQLDGPVCGALAAGNGEGAGLPSAPTVDGVPAGRDPTSGRFAPGNHHGRGSPLAGKAAKLRAALYATATAEDLAAVLQKLIERAKGGDVAASKVLLERLLGPPIALDVATRIERLEILLQGRQP